MKAAYLIMRAYALIVVSVFSVLVVVMMFNLNPKAQQHEEAQLKKAPGDIVVHVVWPNGNIDVDLWVTGPGEPVPVGYSNKGGLLWNLLRDDLGDQPDFTPINYEDAFTRGMPPGEYTVNVQCFACGFATFPMPVDVAVSIRDRKKGDRLDLFARTTVYFNKKNEEKTAFSFTVKEDGKPDPDSISTRYVQLRAATDKPVMQSVPEMYQNNGRPY